MQTEPAPRKSAGLGAANLALLVVLALGWGANWPILKIGITEVSPWVFRSLTFLPSGMLLLALARLNGHPLAVPRPFWPPLLVASTLNITLWGMLVLYGLSFMTGGRAAILAFTMPVWASLFYALLVKKLPSRQVVYALIAGTTGVLLLWLGDPETQARNAWGPLLVIVGGAMWGAGSAYVKHTGFPVPTLVLTGWMQLLGTIPVALIALLWDWQNIGTPGWPQYFSLFYNIVVAGAIMYWIYFTLLKRLTVAMSTIAMLAVPVVAVISDAFWLWKFPLWIDLGALGLIGVAVALALNKPA